MERTHSQNIHMHHTHTHTHWVAHICSSSPLRQGGSKRAMEMSERKGEMRKKGENEDLRKEKGGK